VDSPSKRPEDAKDDHPSRDAASAATPVTPVRQIRSEDLFAGERVVLIQHAEVQYRLLITRNDRLILQK